MSTDKFAPQTEAAKIGRRHFLKGTAAGAAALAVTPAAQAQNPSAFAASYSAPSYQQIQRDTGLLEAPNPERSVVRPGSDLMVQVLKDMGVEFVASNNGSSFEGIQESIANYGAPPNQMPEYITALHEESSVDMANGYGKAEGRPMAAMLHGTIGIQHASMAIYQAFYSGTPMILIVGRDDGFIQAHTANDMAALCRSFTKWDAQPKTLPECLEALQEAYRQAVTPPTGPTVVVIDMELQKEEARDVVVPPFRPAVIEGIDVATARDIAQQLLAANNPRLATGAFRTPEGVAAAVELAELIGASASTSATQGPMGFPQRHPLCGPGADTAYDYVLGLEANSPQLSLQRPSVAALTATRDTAGIGFGGLRANAPAEGRGAARPQQGTTLSIDAQASIPAIIGEVSRLMTPEQRRLIDERKARHAQANQEARMSALRDAIEDKKKGWDLSPVSTARIYAELWPLIMNEDWCLASPSSFSSSHHMQLWDHNKPYSYLGGQGAGGMGYGLGACTGAALAARARGRIVINVQTDGDFNYAPGSVWTAVHHQLPMLTVMHNNRAWHQEFMFIQYMAGVRGRGTDRGNIGTTLRDPFINYAKLAEGYGMKAEGPIDDPTQLAAALQRGIDTVKGGEPYLIDVLTQPR
ncbi:MAG: twin-arginine translocation signal domain-containing protein [Pseudomonadales bacterium]|jgi:thiamine pyrophosphate-dependent acetolactate synthase large subunit-like protein|nr:twin-arginine translocation signal domain-containing protein [Pseudomonadales bacterium]